MEQMMKDQKFADVFRNAQTNASSSTKTDDVVDAEVVD